MLGFLLLLQDFAYRYPDIVKIQTRPAIVLNAILHFVRGSPIGNVLDERAAGQILQQKIGG